jgi:hypothetical protein
MWASNQSVSKILAVAVWQPTKCCTKFLAKVLATKFGMPLFWLALVLAGQILDPNQTGSQFSKLSLEAILGITCLGNLKKIYSFNLGISNGLVQVN